jgi:hypothetical protein
MPLRYSKIPLEKIYSSVSSSEIAEIGVAIVNDVTSTDLSVRDQVWQRQSGETDEEWDLLRVYLEMGLYFRRSLRWLEHYHREGRSLEEIVLAQSQLQQVAGLSNQKDCNNYNSGEILAPCHQISIYLQNVSRSRNWVARAEAYDKFRVALRRRVSIADCGQKLKDWSSDQEVFGMRLSKAISELFERGYVLQSYLMSISASASDLSEEHFEKISQIENQFAVIGRIIDVWRKFGDAGKIGAEIRGVGVKGAIEVSQSQLDA